SSFHFHVFFMYATLFFERSGDPRDPHSFPTRRSSDLSQALFERFISKERNEPPDIDVDFEHQRREEVIQYIYTKYGRRIGALLQDRKSTRLNSSHVKISYAVFCLKKKTLNKI